MSQSPLVLPANVCIYEGDSRRFHSRMA